MLGSYEWGLKTGGSLSRINKLNLILKVIAIQLKKSGSVCIDIDPHTIKIPDSKLVQQSIEYIDDVHDSAVKNHCLRSYVLGEVFGQNEGLNYDSEVYALSAILHDIGLEDRFCCIHPEIDCFAIEGAQVAGEYLQSKQSLSAEKIKRIQDAIALHLNINIPIDLSEAYLLNKASGTDTIGLYLHQLSKPTVSSLMEMYPRHDFNQKVHEMLKKQSNIRPKSRMSFLYQHGFGKRLLSARFN